MTRARSTLSTVGKRCGCNTAAAETSVLAIEGDMLSECVGCGAVWSLKDGTPPDYIAWLLKTHFENGAGTMEWSAKFALASASAVERVTCERCHTRYVPGERHGCAAPLSEERGR